MCGAGPNPVTLMVGRATTDIGGAGIVSGVLIIIAKSAHLPKRLALIGVLVSAPFHSLRQHTVACSTFHIFLGNASFVLLFAYLGDSPAQSGIHNLLTVLSVVVFAIAGGLVVTAVGYYTPFMFAGSRILAIGFQVVFGAGAGIGLGLPDIAVQAVLPEIDFSVGTALLVFPRSLKNGV
ncbi:hypothetical protein BDV23DRAFT_180536 [Aspergillus alliaceus]|uniref:Major facilitator superfamily domain-containing protein n=1 Tax=Petromyces alliaceus TaxID=209559 RepID=A0A5N7CH13_PETAA|nr:hypothetical protein BDV23DRAFT_180536 [Aspergillus alliaceus]